MNKHQSTVSLAKVSNNLPVIKYQQVQETGETNRRYYNPGISKLHDVNIFNLPPYVTYVCVPFAIKSQP